MTAEPLVLEGELADVQRHFVERGWTDGLPIIPPTQELVAALVEASGEPFDGELGPIPPDDTVATIGTVAANAVMAGCGPEHFTTVLAALRGMLHPLFNLPTVQATTHSVGPLIVVHGPQARRIGINGRSGAFGPGFVANAVIGRAIRLVLMNLGGGRPGVGDFSCQGAPSKYTYCITENVEDSPWPEYHTTRGFGPDESAVTVVGAEAPSSVNDHESTTPERNLDLVASVMSHLGSNNWYATTGGSDIIVVLGPEHARMAADAGWSREDVQRYLFHRAMRPAGDLSRGGQWDLRTFSPSMEALAGDPRQLMPMVESASDIMVLVAGGAGKWSSVITTMGNIARAVTVPLADDSTAKE